MSLLPAKTNLVGWRGGTFRKVFTLYTGRNDSSPPRDLTNYTASCLIKDKTGDTLETLTDANGGITLGGEAGTITLFISDEDTAAATWNFGIYELFITNAAGDTDPILFGGFTIKSTSSN